MPSIVVKYWNGSSWIPISNIKVWNGVSWIPAVIKAWDATYGWRQTS